MTMHKAFRPIHSFKARVLSGMLLSALVLIGIGAAVSAQSSGEDWYQTQAIEADDLGITNPVGLTYSPESDALFVFASSGDTGAVSDFLRVNTLGDPLGLGSSTAVVPDPLNVAFYAPTDSLFHLDAGTAELVGVTVGPSGDRAPADQSTSRFNARAFGISEPQGMTFDAAGGQLFVLETGDPVPVLIRVASDPQGSFDGDSALRNGRLERTRLTALRDANPRGLAFNPDNEHLYILGTDDNTLYELTTSGDVVKTRDITSLGLSNPQSLVFAASADRTDDPANQSLFIADAGQRSLAGEPGLDGALSAESTTSASTANSGQIVELSFQLAAAPTALEPASLVQIIDTSKAAWNPSSPDPAGIAYRPATAGLLISDSEVEENHPDFQGFNVFESTTSGNLFATCATTGFSNEPTGAAVNPANGNIFFADDNANAVFEVELGPDNTYCTPDDIASSLSTSVFGAGDPEGLAFGNNKLYISDGVNQEVYIVDLGLDGTIGGSGVDADTLQSQFDTFALGLRDPEGIEYNATNDTLFMVSAIGSDDFLVETTTTGIALNSFDLTFLGSLPRSGLAYGPSSQIAGEDTIYMASRGVDNGADPNENDGKVYEISIGPGGPPPVPTAEFVGSPVAGDTPLTVDFTDLSTGAPTSWSWDFGDGGTSADRNPTHTYTTAGTYTVSLTATNVTGSDTMTKTDYVTVTVPTPPTADFVGSPTTGDAPLTVDFTDQSTGFPTSWSWDFGDGGTSTEQNPSYTYTTPGTYTVTLTATNATGSDGETKIDYIDANVPPPPPASAFHSSFTSNGSVDGLSFNDEDILWYDGTGWSIFFDGSDVGIGGEDVNAFHVVDADTILMSFTNDAVVSGLTVQDHDIVEFTATSTGPVTAGSFTLYFDGEDVELAATGEDIDALDVLDDGRIVVSTVGSPSVTGVSGAKDEDVLAFTPTTLGETTSGTWAMYLDSSDTDITLVSGADVNAVNVATNGDIYLSTDNLVTVGGVSSEDEDVAFCTPSSLGPNTVCSFPGALYFDGSAWALDGNDIDGISIPAVPTTPSADFVGDPVSGDAPLTVNFTDQSTAGPTSWSWDFGDGATSTAQNPSHTYTTAGTYTVSLTATNGNGSDNVTKVDYITVDVPPPPPVADFSGTPTSGLTPLTVDFTDLSTNSPTSWSWDFGDGATSTAQNPSHTYTTAGTYTVALTATNATGGDTMTKVDYITVTDPPLSPLYMSLKTNAIVGGVNAGDEDILWYDGTAWSLLFDGSDVGVAGDLTAFHIIDANQILMSFSKPNTFGGVSVDDRDIALFTATTLGENTTGTFSLFFDGDLVDLTTQSEDIDAVHLLADGSLIISTLGTPSVTGVGDAKDEDLLRFTPTTPGDYTVGTWDMYFDASDVGISGGNDVIAVSVAANGDLYLSVDTTVVVGTVTVDDEDVLVCENPTLGANSACFTTSQYFDGGLWALESNDLDGLGLP